jgi:hypothetical protein
MDTVNGIFTLNSFHFFSCFNFEYEHIRKSEGFSYAKK